MRFIKAKLSEANQQFIAHGCNAQGVMGYGVALDIKQKWPECFQSYKNYCKWDNIVGSTHEFHTDDGVTILNIITQEFYGRDGKYASYWVIQRELRNAVLFWGIKELAIPKIGCGTGGLKWEIMLELLLEIEDELKVEFFVYEV